MVFLGFPLKNRVLSACIRDILSYIKLKLFPLLSPCSEQWPDGSSTVSDGGADRFIHAKVGGFLNIMIVRLISKFDSVCAKRKVEAIRVRWLTRPP